MHAPAQESSDKMAHIASKDEGYAIIGSMLSSLGSHPNNTMTSMHAGL